MSGGINGTRKPAVAGTFYPAVGDYLLAEVKNHLSGAALIKSEKVMGAISPHAGWYYSGHVAGALFGGIRVPDKVIILGPNHKGAGHVAAFDDSSGWEFPFGTVPVDGGLCDAISQKCPLIEYDSAAHAGEHSLEVIIPFLYARNADVSIAPISLYTHDKSDLAEISGAVAAAAESFGALVVASSDMSHYLPDPAARRIDRATIKAVESMDYAALLENVKLNQGLCGAPAVAVAMESCRQNGARRAKLVKYATSGDIEGGRDAVVGYGGFVIF
ncbi:MAG: MEMO1 family protein [bacterium]|nr:MAG: MEMO1 family protein [bacterium]